jgi:hypothetical protein
MTYVQTSGNADKTFKVPGNVASELLGAQKKTPTDFSAPAKETKDYKYFARPCRALSRNGRIKIPKLQVSRSGHFERIGCET